jgi:hypothetical protein
MPVTPPRQPPAAAGGERPAEEGGDRPHGDLLGPDGRSRHEVGQDHEGRAAQHGCRKEAAVVRPDQKPDDVWGHQADEPDEAGHRHGRRREQGSRGQRAALEPFDVDAELGCALLAQRHDVQVADRERGRHEPDGKERRRHPHRAPPPGAEAPEQPEVDGLDLLSGEGHDE